MRFEHIRLAGFKSFADPTIIPVAGALTGVVGPNGCGKSNVIDAIRWVMGERSASALRGEDMHDVIFNGSDKRPAADRASVELHFNSVHLPGDSPWSAFHELSIKRLIYRNQTSDYFINNQKVRRKDVADLFLGTGLGPRSYAIIEQGMVSRIIESNPKELRVYLEEAAGVSKYKERRGETESRMEDARSNLNRVEDIRVEVVAQVERLRGQAEVALRYQTLQQAYLSDQRLVAVMQWTQSLAEHQKAYQQYLSEQTALETFQSKITEMDRLRSEKEAQWQTARDLLEEAQSDLMAYNAQVAELEQDLRLNTQRRGHMEQDQHKITARLEQLKEQRARLEEEASVLLEQKEALQTERLAAEAQFQSQLQMFYSAEKKLATMRQLTEQSREISTREISLISAELAELKALDSRLLDIRRRVDAVTQSLLTLGDQPLDEIQTMKVSAISPYQEVWEEAVAQEEFIRERMEELTQTLVGEEAQAQENHQQLAMARQQESGLAGRIQTLERQLAANAQHHESLPSWLEGQGMLPSAPLEEVIQIEGRWEHAIAVVLADWLGMRWLPQWRSIADISSATLPIGRLIINDQRPNIILAPKLGTLAEFIQVEDPGFSPWLVAWLSRYRVCDDWQGALMRRHELAPQEYWVSDDGVIVGQYDLHFPGDGGTRAIHLENRHALEQSREEQKKLAQTIQELLIAKEQYAKKCERLYAQKKELSAQQEQLGKRRQGLADQEREWQFQQKSTLEKADWQRREWEKQKCEWAQDEQECLIRQSKLRPLSEQRQREQAEREEKMLQDLEAFRLEEINVRDQREAMRNQELLVQRLQHQVDQVNRDAHRVNEQLRTNAQQAEETQEQWESMVEEMENLPQVEEVDQSLQEMLTLRKSQEEKVSLLRTSSELVLTEQKQTGNDRLKYERQVESVREKMNGYQLAMQACDLRSQQYREHYVRYGGDLQALAYLDTPTDILAEGADNTRNLAQIAKDIQESELKMKALEPVNLAAITELEHESARLAELEKQSLDLNTALDTLQSAITRIDQEMRSRMQEVFERVNVKFGELFRLIFGGGHAEILLTGEEILDAGVMLKAQPLGKNNASIHLLSGGEKALTAISLVFAFFSLNPAPFCVLDEVDAPLDDANTRRFNELIRDMSVKTQFLVISHNRITMEAMESLIGVTMRDPGISKVVSVDLLNAVASVDKAVAVANDVE